MTACLVWRLRLSGSQQVRIGGKYECDIVTLHSTVNQIVCKTRHALEGSWTGQKHPFGGQYYVGGDWPGHRVPLDSEFRHGWTNGLNVVVYVNGLVRRFLRCLVCTFLLQRVLIPSNATGVYLHICGLLGMHLQVLESIPFCEVHLEHMGLPDTAGALGGPENSADGHVDNISRALSRRAFQLRRGKVTCE